ncbi:g1048 [Coccomyxa viridis]|uniref:tryptophan synthase n=1 Tax=Coccomyxa viridis TaxID=1274662 RepID=A0ABP1FNZ5_9CHLO
MAKLKEQGRGAFIPFIVAGDPNMDATEQALLALDRAGADIIELGVPYSDPLADGPTIQAAATRALAAGCTLNKAIDVVRRASPKMQASILMFTYFNPIMRRGLEQFCRDIKEAGASGLLVPDIPLEETGPVREVATAAGLELVLLTTPTTPLDRMEAIATVSQGFVYLVSVTGVTGQRTSMESRVEGLIEQLHSITDKAVAVGFGVSGPEQAKQIMEWGAEGVIVGSALVKALGDAASPEEGLQAMEKLARSIREAI